MKAKNTAPTGKSASPEPQMSFFSWRVRISPRRPKLPISVGSHDAFRKTSENHGGFRSCVAAQGGGDHCGGGGVAQPKKGGVARPAKPAPTGRVFRRLRTPHKNMRAAHLLVS